ncbi:MAG TPA: hypothetical protein VEQ63_09635, partial [Bryobacteraceae bacterium]|nr:hypothetical protein [Bryobacteraceae bacterium]
MAPWNQSAQSWISKASGIPYFLTSAGEPWAPIGQNDAITWPEFADLYKGRSMATTEAYLRMLAEHGVTCLRLMMEYSQTGYRYFERNNGSFNPFLVELWDTVFNLCRQYGLKVLLTPYDTFWMWNKWKKHPYNTSNGGPCGSRNQWLLCGDTRKRIKRRLDFATQRWGWDGTIFAWDLWNEIHPAHAGDSAESLFEFVEDISTHLRETEQRLHGATHLQTVSVFLPVLGSNPQVGDVVFRHPCLDMVNIHLYESGTIDNPRNTVDAAVSTGRLIANAVDQAPPDRPVFDSEHGPIHAFKDRHRTLSADFDDEYFRHIQWAHLASGGAGGGMRWPNRHPHSLTVGMRKAQRMMANFLPYLDWKHFARRTLTGKLEVSRPGVEAFGCSDGRQALLYLLRRDTLTAKGMLNGQAEPVTVQVRLPGLQPGAY